MAFISMSAKYDLLYTPIPNAFIDFYVPTTNPTFSIIYIYAFRNCINGNADLEMKDIAKVLNILESDVLNAWKYFESINLVTTNTDDDNNFSVEFLPVPQNNQNKKVKELPTKIEVPDKNELLTKIELFNKNELLNETRGIISKTKPRYSQQEIDIYINQSEEISKLFKSFERALGKLLNHTDLEVIFGFYDWLRLPIDVIETLLEYCVSNGNRAMNYIEKVAIDWSENQINTVYKANLYVERFNISYRTILKAFGQGFRNPVDYEIEFMDTWLDTYKMPLEIILNACSKSIKNTGKPAFEYTNTILTNWNTANVRTLDAIKVYDVEFKAKQLEKNKNNAEKRTVQNFKKPKFANYKGRTWDYKQIEKLEEEYTKNKLEGN